MSCGVTIRRDGQSYTVASTDERASGWTSVNVGRLPCLQALDSAVPAAIADVDAEQRRAESCRWRGMSVCGRR